MLFKPIFDYAEVILLFLVLPADSIPAYMLYVCVVVYLVNSCSFPLVPNFTYDEGQVRFESSSCTAYRSEEHIGLLTYECMVNTCRYMPTCSTHCLPTCKTHALSRVSQMWPMKAVLLVCLLIAHM